MAGAAEKKCGKTDPHGPHWWSDNKATYSCPGTNPRPGVG